ncbi:MAG: hypothetical protein N2C12_07080 [Planctomycetales bacterium]
MPAWWARPQRLGMIDILSTPWSRSIMMFAAIAALIVIGAYVLSKWRGAADEDTLTPSELLTIFREMHSQGDLSDEEFRTIKTKIAYELQQKIKDSEDEG